MKSTPMVVRWLYVNLSSVNRWSRADLPTEELPTMTYFRVWSTLLIIGDIIMGNGEVKVTKREIIIALLALIDMN